MMIAPPGAPAATTRCILLSERRDRGDDASTRVRRRCAAASSSMPRNYRRCPVSADGAGTAASSAASSDTAPSTSCEAPASAQPPPPPTSGLGANDAGQLDQAGARAGRDGAGAGTAVRNDDGEDDDRSAAGRRARYAPPWRRLTGGGTDLPRESAMRARRSSHAGATPRASMQLHWRGAIPRHVCPVWSRYAVAVRFAVSPVRRGPRPARNARVRDRLGRAKDDPFRLSSGGLVDKSKLRNPYVARATQSRHTHRAPDRHGDRGVNGGRGACNTEPIMICKRDCRPRLRAKRRYATRSATCAVRANALGPGAAFQ